MAQVTELITKFSFAGSTAPLFTFNKGMGSAIKLSAAFSVALLAGAAAFTKWSSSALQALDPLAQIAKRSDVAIGRIQELGFIATQSGSSIGAMQGSILSLSQTIGDAALKGSDDFSRLGISVRDSSGQIKNADDVLGEMGDRFKELNLSMLEQESIAQSLGIDATLVQMLNKSSSEIADLTAEARMLGTLTGEQSEQIIEYNAALNKQRFAISGVKQAIAVGFAPTLTELTDNFTKLIAENKDWITNVAAQTIDIVVEIGDAIGNTAGAIFDFVDAISGGNAKPVFLLAVAAAGVAIAPVAATIAAIVLVVDDLVTAMNGGDSVIATFFDQFLGVDILPVLNEINLALELMGTLITDLVSLNFGKIGSSLGDMFSATGQGFQRLFSGGSFSNPTTNTNSVNQDVAITINTNDPLAAGQAVSENLQRQLENADTQSRAGGQ